VTGDSTAAVFSLATSLPLAPAAVANGDSLDESQESAVDGLAVGCRVDKSQDSAVDGLAVGCRVDKSQDSAVDGLAVGCRESVSLNVSQDVSDDVMAVAGNERRPRDSATCEPRDNDDVVYAGGGLDICKQSPQRNN